MSFITWEHYTEQWPEVELHANVKAKRLLLDISIHRRRAYGDNKCFVVRYPRSKMPVPVQRLFSYSGDREWFPAAMFNTPTEAIAAVLDTEHFYFATGPRARGRT